METKRKKKFYWLEGVTQKEIETALSANKYPMLYQQSVRRKLVVLYGLLLTVLLMTTVIGWDNKVGSYVYSISAIVVLLLYLVLRKSVRMVADAPTELLDERLVFVRDRSYLFAYRWLFTVLALYTVALGTSLLEAITYSPGVFFILFGISLPSMVLAWMLPSEKTN